MTGAERGGKRVILITGANKGIGLAITKALVTESEDCHVLVGCRDTQKGADAIRDLSDQKGSLELLEVDVTDQASVDRAASQVRSKYPEGLYCLVNNAGVGYDVPFNKDPLPSSVARDTLKVNLKGCVAATRAFLPLLKRPGGRVVNVSSGAAGQHMEKVSEERRRQLLSDDLTTEQLLELAAEFTQTFESEWSKPEQERSQSAGGWHLNAYGFSKACMNSYTRILARENPDLTINCCTPGFVRTEMTAQYAGEVKLKTPEEGAVTPAWLVNGDITSTGGFWGNDCRQLQWVGYAVS